jgi:hypothetical protein
MWWPIRAMRNVLAAARTGHLGPTVFRSLDAGKTWKEAAKPPAFTEGAGASSITRSGWRPGTRRSPAWYGGTSPQGFPFGGRRRYMGRRHRLQPAPKRKDWAAIRTARPMGLASLDLVDPRDPKHLDISMSSGARSSRRTPGRLATQRRRARRFSAEPDLEYGYDPHAPSPAAT